MCCKLNQYQALGPYIPLILRNCKQYLNDLCDESNETKIMIGNFYIPLKISTFA